MTHILHINDNNLLIQQSLDAGGDIVQRSRGYAWLNGDEVRFDLNSDTAPVRHLHLKPQEINSRYWQQCAENSIPPNGAGMRHAADLVWRHLAELKSAVEFQDLALIVPAHYQDTHLRLLLGVAKANGIDVSAMFAKPVYAVRQYAETMGEFVHVDVQLHQTVVSKVAVSERSLELTHVDTNADVSLSSLQDGLLQALQQRFIQHDRFDPLHDAETEQQLFDQLPTIVAAALTQEKAPVGVQHKGRLYNTTFERSDVESSFSDLLDLIGAKRVHVIVDMNNGFDLSQLNGSNITNLSWASMPQALHSAELSSKNESGDVVYRTSLPFLKPKSVSKPKSESLTDATHASELKATESDLPKVSQLEAADEISTVTHLMQLGVAVPLNNASIVTDEALLKLSIATQASDDVSDMLKRGKLEIVNEPSRTYLKPNDRLMSPIADGVITAISVSESQS